MKWAFTRNQDAVEDDEQDEVVQGFVGIAETQDKRSLGDSEESKKQNGGYQWRKGAI